MRLSAACAFPGGHRLVWIWLLLVWSTTQSWRIWSLPLKIAGLCIGSRSIDVRNAAFHVDVRRKGLEKSSSLDFFVFWIFALLSLSNKHNDVGGGGCKAEWDRALDPGWCQTELSEASGAWQCERDLPSQVPSSFADKEKPHCWWSCQPLQPTARSQS